MTALAEQLRETTIGRVSRLYTIAMREMENTGGNCLASQRRIADAIQNDPGLMRELCGDELRELLERKAWSLANQVREDRRGTALKREGEASQVVPQKAVSPAPPLPRTIRAEAAVAPAAVRDREGMGLSRGADGQRPPAHPPRETNDGEGGLHSGAHDGHTRVAPSPSPQLNGGGQASCAGGLDGVAPSREPYRPGHARLTIADNTRLQPVMAKTLLSYRLANSQLLHRMTFKEAAKIETVYRKDALLLAGLRKHAANIPSNATIGEIITETVFGDILAQVDAKMANDA